MIVDFQHLSFFASFCLSSVSFVAIFFQSSPRKASKCLERVVYFVWLHMIVIVNEVAYFLINWNVAGESADSINLALTLPRKVKIEVNTWYYGKCGIIVFTVFVCMWFLLIRLIDTVAYILFLRTWTCLVTTIMARCGPSLHGSRIK